MQHTDIGGYIKEKQSEYETQEIRVGDNWNWNMRNHIQLIFHLKNGVFYSGHNDFLRSFKNIMEPILNLAYWTEDIEVKDVVFFIESENGRGLSFLIKKYHDEVYVREHDLDELFDEITESDLDFGGVVVQKGKKRPEIKPLNSIAFCDQTNILGGPIGFKESFSPEALREMKKKGWGEKSNGATIGIEELILLAEDTKETQGMRDTKRNEVTGKNIDAYMVMGSLPEHYLEDNGNMDDWFYQVQVVVFYIDKDSKRQHVTLFRKKGSPDMLKFFTSQKVHGRALGRGKGEALIHPQIWTNFLEIHKLSLLEAGSKVVLYTDDENFTNRNEVQDMEQLEILTIADKKIIRNVPTLGTNQIQLMEQGVDSWFNFAQLTGEAFDPQLGKEAVSGTTFRGQERTVAQGRGAHDRRRGKRAKFIEKDLYRPWIIPEIVREITDGTKFLATLSSDELQWVSEQMAQNHANKIRMDAIFALEEPRDEEELKQEFLKEFQKKGNKHLIEILKGEFKDIEVKMGINIAGKQKNLADLSDKVLSIFQFAFADPIKWQQGMQIPGLAKMFNNLLEFSGMNEVDFTNFVSNIPQLPAGQGQPQAQPSPLELNKAPVA